jgi:hypothetical protein
VDPGGVGKFPFLFYGVRPDDWAEAANLGHTYVARFRGALDTKARDTIVQAFVSKLEKLASKTAKGSVREWKWDNDWVSVAVGEDHEDDVEDSIMAASLAPTRSAEILLPRYRTRTPPTNLRN